MLSCNKARLRTVCHSAICSRFTLCGNCEDMQTEMIQLMSACHQISLFGVWNVTKWFIVFCKNLYALSQIKQPPSLWQIWTNFNNSFTVAFYSELRKKLYLTSNVLPHYLAKFECSVVQLYDSHLIQECDRSFIYSIYLQKSHVLDHISVPIN